ncbi:putative L-tryptophan oxidase VioA [Balamuthia mandrillaris]
MMREVAVVGAGVSGLACARRLLAAGWRITLFDKAKRAAGGRVSTKRLGEGSRFHFDHGAQYFTCKDPIFVEATRQAMEAGFVQEWHGRFAAIEEQEEKEAHINTYHVLSKHADAQPSRYVGVPGMSSFTWWLSEPLRECTHLDRLVASVTWLPPSSSTEKKGEEEEATAEERKKGGVWRLVDDKGNELGCFEGVVISTPSPQALPLLEDAPTEMKGVVSQVRMVGTWAVMLGFSSSISSPSSNIYDGYFVNVKASPLGWISRNSSKPQRKKEQGGEEAEETWVLHASPEWSEVHMEDSPESVSQVLHHAFIELMRGAGILEQAQREPEPSVKSAHRWRYARADPPLDGQEGFLFDGRRGLLGCCGDWVNGNRVEGAYVSGHKLAERFLREAGCGAQGGHPLQKAVL